MDNNSIPASLKAMSNGAGTQLNKRLPAAKALPQIPARVGSSAPKATPTVSSGGGIASPVIEDVSNGREYWAERPLKSTDGLIYGKWAPIRQLNMHDSANAAVVFSFRDQPIS